MAEVVVPAQVFKQLVIIEVTVIAELAERVSSVTGVVRVSMRSVTCQFLTVVPFTLMGEDLVVGEVTFKYKFRLHMSLKYSNTQPLIYLQATAVVLGGHGES